jgi:hypothetical protein
MDTMQAHAELFAMMTLEGIEGMLRGYSGTDENGEFAGDEEADLREAWLVDRDKPPW